MPTEDRRRYQIGGTGVTDSYKLAGQIHVCYHHPCCWHWYWHCSRWDPWPSSLPCAGFPSGSYNTLAVSGQTREPQTSGSTEDGVSFAVQKPHSFMRSPLLIVDLSAVLTVLFRRCFPLLRYSRKIPAFFPIRFSVSGFYVEVFDPCGVRFCAVW